MLLICLIRKKYNINFYEKNQSNNLFQNNEKQHFENSNIQEKTENEILDQLSGNFSPILKIAPGIQKDKGFCKKLLNCYMKVGNCPIF